MVLIVAGLLAVLTLANRLTEPVVPMFDASVQSQYAEGIERETAMLAPGSQAEYKVIRQGETMALEAELGRRLAPANKRR